MKLIAERSKGGSVFYKFKASRGRRSSKGLNNIRRSLPRLFLAALIIMVGEEKNSQIFAVANGFIVVKG